MQLALREFIGLMTLDELMESKEKVAETVMDLAAVKVADLGETMPPKSTWFEPKFLVGLVTHLMD